MRKVRRFRFSISAASLPFSPTTLFDSARRLRVAAATHSDRARTSDRSGRGSATVPWTVGIVRHSSAVCPAPCKVRVSAVR